MIRRIFPLLLRCSDPGFQTLSNSNSAHNLQCFEITCDEPKVLVCCEFSGQYWLFEAKFRSGISHSSKDVQTYLLLAYRLKERMHSVTKQSISMNHIIRRNKSVLFNTLIRNFGQRIAHVLYITLCLVKKDFTSKTWSKYVQIRYSVQLNKKVHSFRVPSPTLLRWSPDVNSCGCIRMTGNYYIRYL